MSHNKEALLETPKPAPTTEWVCAGCGVQCSRPKTKGQRPKWCPDCRDSGRRQSVQVECAQCGAACQTWRLGRFCSRDCSSAAARTGKTRPPSRTPEEMAELWRTQWSPLRKAVEDSDHAGVIAAVAAKSQMTAAGCWEWQGKRSTTRGGGSPYPAVKLGKVNAQVHRLVLEAKHGAALGSQTAHHMCANTICVNPDHLQPVTHRDNIAEMLARHSYLARIEELEAALAVLNPTHELLKVIAVA